MFADLTPAPADPILGLNDEFRKDPNPLRVNLGPGVYVDETGQCPILASVSEAQWQIRTAEATKTYAPIEGVPGFAPAVLGLLFGSTAAAIGERAAVIQTPGGTAALRLAGELVRRARPQARVWLSDPTWPNHPEIFRAAGLDSRGYPYFDESRQEPAFDRMLAAIREIPAGDVVVLHGCCHNPTGADLAPRQWAEVADVIGRRGLLPLIDLAYQGLGGDLTEDVVGVAALVERLPEVMIAGSFSKNFGLYNERAGSLTVVTPKPGPAVAVLSHLKALARACYSSPPAHGATVVATILSGPALRDVWEAELGRMRGRIRAMRELLVARLAAVGVRRDMSFVARQRGMFSLLGVTPEQVDRLRARHSVYVTRSGRVNVACVTEANAERVAAALADVL